MLFFHVNPVTWSRKLIILVCLDYSLWFSALLNEIGGEVLHEFVPLLTHRVVCNILVTWLVILA